MLKIKISTICQNEQRYALDIMLGEFLGLPFEVDEYEGEYIEITRPDGAGKLTLDASFFRKAHQAWLKSESMPVLPLANWMPVDDGINASLVDPSVPVLYGQPGLVKTENHLHLNLDVFGSVFFMLSRYEELIIEDRDIHGRFPAWASIAYKADFLERPVVNEYLEIIWVIFKRLWPELSRKERKFRKIISCDVDHPIDYSGYSLKRTALRFGARLVRDKEPKLAIYDALNYFFKKFNSDRFDQYKNNVDWIMKVNSVVGNKVAFYFIPIQTNASKEDSNDVRSSKISKLLKHIIDSGHEVGFHPGYNTCISTSLFKKSANAFKEALKNQSIEFSEIGGRQHYLMYDVSKTPQLWEDNGFSYDSSLGFADKPGFRCGVCYEFSMYDLITRKKIHLKQRPLILMDVSLMSSEYENISLKDPLFLERVFKFKKIAHHYNGDFTLLWHNSSTIKNNQYLESIA
jgi:hypothetical protein